MSTETLKFFENKSSEEIINWMLENLSEEQIRMCLEQSGIPNTNLIESQGEAPMTSISPSAAMTSISPTSATERSILLLKGLVYGIPEEKYEEALREASRIISERKITTIAWDGDKYTYPGAGGAAPATSFTRLLPLLLGEHPNLEFLFFKKEGKARGLLVGGAIEADNYGNVLGPIPFMSEENTTIIREEDAAPPPPMAGRYYGCEFGGIAKWYELGLRGMQYCKEKLGAESVEVLVLGLGKVVEKENEKIDEEPGKYPNRNFTIINVDRESTTSPGTGSSDPLPVSTASVMPDTTVMPDDNLLYNYRNKCKGTQYIIKSVSNFGVEYYEFKEIDDEDDVISSGVTIGDGGWVKKTVPVQEFNDFCTDQDIEDLKELKEGNMETFLGAPEEIKQVSNEYKLSGLEPPLPEDTSQLATEDTSQLAPEDNIGDLTNEMLKAIRIQQASENIIKEKYPNLYEKKLTMFPVFVYGMEGEFVLFLKGYVEDDKLILKKDSSTVRVLNSRFKNITLAIDSKIKLGMYSPSENMQDELNEASKEFTEILPKISKFYDKDYLAKFDNVSFGTLEDDYDEYENMYYGKIQDVNPTYGRVSPTIYKKTISKSSRCKKVSDMTIPEIEEHMKTLDSSGTFYRTYKPDKYTNILGVDSVKYVLRESVLPENELNMPYNNDPIIEGFGMDYGSDAGSELLFG